MKVVFEKIVPKKYVKYRTKKGNKESVTQYGVKVIDMDKISVDELVKRYGRKKWIERIKIVRYNNCVEWKYPGKPSIWIYRDGFYVRADDKMEYGDKEISYTAYRCASILDEIGAVVLWVEK